MSSASMSRVMKTMRLRRSALGPARQGLRRVEQVLHAVDDHRMLRVVGQLHDALDAQQVVATHRRDHVQPGHEAFARERLVAHDDVRADVVVVPVRVVLYPAR